MSENLGTTSAADYQRQRGLEDLIYFAREIAGYTKSKIEWVVERIDETGKTHKERRKEEREGPAYGISRDGPHAQMAALIESPSQAKCMSCSRDAFKTSLAIIAIAQAICKNPNIRILYSQATKREAQKKIDAVARLVNEGKVHDIYGVTLRQDGDLWSVEGRDPKLVDPTLEAGGVDSELTGSHRDWIILDDPVTWLNVRSVDAIKKTRAYYDQLQPLLDPMSMLLVILTPYDHGDLSRDIVINQADEFEILLVDCGMTPHREPGQPWKLLGKPRFKHLTEEYLLSRLKRMGYRRFMANYCLRVVHDENQQFVRQSFRSRPYTSALARSVRGYILTDTAVSTKDDSCQRVVATVGLDGNDYAYLFELRVGRWPSQMVPIQIADAFERWTGEGLKIAGIALEAVTFNEPFRAQIEHELGSRHMHARIIPTPRAIADVNKDRRIEGLGLRFDQGRFIVLSSVDKWFDDGGETATLWDPVGWTENGIAYPAGELVEQFIRFPTYRRKDIADALADLDICDKNGRRILRGAGLPPREATWSAGSSKDIQAAIRNLMRDVEEGGPPPSSQPPRRRAGDRWRHLRLG